jgi:hypothetical protein
MAFVGEVHRWLLKGKTEHPMRLGRDVRQRNRGASGVPVKMELVEAVRSFGTAWTLVSSASSEAYWTAAGKMIPGRRSTSVTPTPYATAAGGRACSACGCSSRTP